MPEADIAAGMVTIAVIGEGDNGQPIEDLSK
jgi:hypothetical protein